MFKSKVMLMVEKNNKFNAGPKAPNDISIIFKKNFNSKIDLIEIDNSKNGNYVKNKLIRGWFFFKNLFYNGIIFYQHPICYKPFFTNFIKKEKSIIIIHDINNMRFYGWKELDGEISVINSFNYIVAHNEKMKEYLINKGVAENKIYILECFDYLCEETLKIKRKYNNEKVICYAGNLKKEKCQFVYQIDSEKIDFKLNLYGLGIEKDLSDNIKYKGAYAPEELPQKMQGNLGLVWDGKIDESDENDECKNYTKYNNPHKLSCYIAAELPVIVWDKAAIANFVKKYNIGYTISNLYDINYLDLGDYEEKLKNVRKLSKKVRDGYFIKRVIDKILRKIQ